MNEDRLKAGASLWCYFGNNTKQSQFVCPSIHNLMTHSKNTEERVPIYSRFSPN